MKKLSASEKFEEGLILFARYAYAANYFRYCGPDKNKDIGEALKGSFDQQELREILNHFDAAVPYLNLIAKSNNITDPFDTKVVEAYWLGNDLLLQVPNQAVYQHLADKVKKRAKSNWRNLESEIGFGIKPNHSFHVLDIYRIAGFTMDGTKGLPVIDLINNCMISWGIVETSNLKPFDRLRAGSQTSKIGSKKLLIKSQLIKVKNNKFVLEPEVKTAENTGLDIKEGDLVSIHWGFICDKISERQKKNLEFWTKYHLKITNQFI